MWDAVYEIGESDQCGRQANGRAIEGRDQDLGMCIEGIRDIQVVGYESPKPVPVYVFAFRN